MTPQERAEWMGQLLNRQLHEGLGIDEPCDSACTHVLSDDLPGMTLLGIANVFARAAEKHLTDRDARFAQPRHSGSTGRPS